MVLTHKQKYRQQIKMIPRDRVLHHANCFVRENSYHQHKHDQRGLKVNEWFWFNDSQWVHEVENSIEL